MRVALLTAEYPIKGPDQVVYGIGVYVRRMARALYESGHYPEVFAPTNEISDTVDDKGIKVHRVNWKKNRLRLRLLSAVSRRILRARGWREPSEWILQANGLAFALEKRHKVQPFHLIQSTDFLATGLWVQRRSGRVHAVRCSTAADLCNQAEHTRGMHESIREVLERWAMRRADVVYAPSYFVANHFRNVHNIKVEVVRPPAYLEIEPAAEAPFPLPGRFLFHFGSLCNIKGSDLLARALLIAWEQAPDITMLWSGICERPGQIKEWRLLWGKYADQVHFTGEVPKPQLYAVLAQADAAVLPSQVDNLPNTVIESLLFGVPVIGSRHASIDELVEEGRTGYLVPLGDAATLAETLVRVWQGLGPVKKGFEWTSAIREQMRPEEAVGRLLELAEITAAHGGGR
jgi:glycogen synthase